MKVRSRTLATVLAGLLLVAPGAASIATAEAAPATVNSKTLLSQLPVRAEVKSGYARAKFRHWVDADKDRCNTRKEVLIAEAARKPKVKKATCAISGGRWASKYDGKTTTNPSRFDIDHMVPLKEAWDSGAKSWTATTRQKFANDLSYAPSLIAVSAASNRSKGDKDPAAWLPPKAAYRCTYAKQWVAVKWRWKLSVDSAEKKALTRVLRSCGTNLKVAKPARASVKTSSTSTARPRTDPRFSTCALAKRAGYGPYTRGKHTEYTWYRDADRDGVVCE